MHFEMRWTLYSMKINGELQSRSCCKKSARKIILFYNIKFFVCLTTPFQLRRLYSWACKKQSKMENIYSVLLIYPEQKSQLQRRSCKRVDNIKMDIKDIGCNGVNWIAFKGGISMR